MTTTRRVIRENPGQIVWACASYACLTLALLLAGVLISDRAFGYLPVTGFAGTLIIAIMASYYLRAANSRMRGRAGATVVLTNAGAVAFVIVLALPRYPNSPPDGFIPSLIGATGLTAALTTVGWVVCNYIFDRIFVLARRFPAPHECQWCGYDLTGNVSGRCPECGAAVDGDAG